MENFSDGFGKRLKLVMLDKSVTVKALASELHYDVVAVSHWRTGTTIPPVTTLYNICKALDTSADYLLGLTGDDEVSA